MQKAVKSIALAFLVFSTSVSAIVDIESLRLDESIQGFSGSLTASMSGKNGNTEGENYDAATGLQWVDGQQVNMLVFSGEYAEVRGTEVDKQYFVHARHTNKLDQAWAWEAFGQYEAQPLNNEFTRSLAGLGGRYSLAEAALQGSAGFGVMLENQSIEINDETVEDSLIRLNLYAKGQYDISKSSQFAVGFYVQPEAADFANTTSIGSFAFSNEINQHLSMTFDYSFQHVSEPLEGLKETDTQYQFGINYRFGEK